MSHSICNVCGWVSKNWPTEDQAGNESTWHVYEEHPEVWRGIFLNSTPTDPDPRREERADGPHG